MRWPHLEWAEIWDVISAYSTSLKGEGNSRTKGLFKSIMRLLSLRCLPGPFCAAVNPDCVYILIPNPVEPTSLPPLWRSDPCRTADRMHGTTGTCRVQPCVDWLSVFERINIWYPKSWPLGPKLTLVCACACLCVIYICSNMIWTQTSHQS